MTTKKPKGDAPAQPVEFGIPKFARIPLAKLVIDPSYQRNISKAHAKSIVARFNPGLLGVLSVNKRAGSTVYHVIDGGHRTWALGKLDPKEWGGLLSGVECLVYEGLTPEQEARLFTITNSWRKNPTVAEKFRARLVAHDPDALAIDAIVRAEGCVLVLPGGTDHGHRRIAGIAMIEGIYKTNGATGLRDVLDVALGAWGSDPAATDHHVLQGLAYFLRNPAYRDADRRRLKTQLSKITVLELLARGRSIALPGGNRIDKSLATMIAQLYNSKLRSNRLPDLPA